MVDIVVVEVAVVVEVSVVVEVVVVVILAVVLVVILVVVVVVVVVVEVVTLKRFSYGNVYIASELSMLRQESYAFLSPQFSLHPSTMSAQQSPICTQKRLGTLNLKYWLAGQIL